MLLFTAKDSTRSVDGATRIPLLERLQEKNLLPLIRAARVHCFELALLETPRAKEMERTIAAWSESSENSLYVRGDLFCFEDYALYLIFDDEESNRAFVRAGIVYEAWTKEPLKKLDAFCREIDDALTSVTFASRTQTPTHESTAWRLSEERGRAALSRFVSTESTDAHAHELEEASEFSRALEVLEDERARRLLRFIVEEPSPIEVGMWLANDEHDSRTEALINRLFGGGLLRRELLVSCRKSEHALLRWPASDALQVITSSNAVCGHCGINIADEQIEEIIAATDIAAKLLHENTWLTRRFRSVLLESGIPESEIAVNPLSGGSESQLIANVCGEPFLCLLKEGDFDAANARRALELLNETEAAHLVVVAMGKIQDDARARLREYTGRRARDGSVVELLLIEGFDAAGAELQHAFERVSNRVLARELFALDASLGLSIGYMLATRFRLMQKADALQDIAESAVGALAGSLREI